MVAREQSNLRCRLAAKGMRIHEDLGVIAATPSGEASVAASRRQTLLQIDFKRASLKAKALQKVCV